MVTDSLSLSRQLITAPRRSSVVPNPSGVSVDTWLLVKYCSDCAQEVALFSASEYSFETHASSASWNLMDLESGETTLLTDDSNVSEMIWLGTNDSGLLYINSTNADIPGGVELWVSDMTDFANSYVLCVLRE